MEEIAIQGCCSIGARPTRITSSRLSPPLGGKMRSFFRWESGTSWRLQASVLGRARISSPLIRSSTNGGETVLRNFSVFPPLRPSNGGILPSEIDIFWLFLWEGAWGG